MKQILLPILAATTFIVIVGMLYGTPNKSSKFFVKSTPTPSVEARKSIKIGSVNVFVAVANTEEKRMEGLSGVKSLQETEGLLFVFDKKGVEPSFWMKDMLIPIDIIWIVNGKIAKIDKNIQPPEPNMPDAGLKLYKPSGPIDYVLEVNAGFADKNKIKVGSPVTIE